MARLVRGCPTPWSQGTREPETNNSVFLQEEQTDTIGGKVITDYNMDIDYKLEGSDPDTEAVNEEEENSHA